MLALLRSQREFEQSLDYYHDCRPDCSQPLLPLPQIHYLDCSVQWGTGEGVIVFGVDDDLHDIVGVSLKHLVTGPLLVPVPQLDQHVIYNTQQPVSLHMSSTTQNCWKYTILRIHKSSLSASTTQNHQWLCRWYNSLLLCDRGMRTHKGLKMASKLIMYKQTCIIKFYISYQNWLQWNKMALMNTLSRAFFTLLNNQQFSTGWWRLCESCR